MELDYIEIKGAREHNLAVDLLRVPKKKLVVFTGVSGSGKSSLAFDTLYAEGQRRYVESLSSYARQFLGQMEKPQYDHIRGLSPTIAIEQKTASGNPRSTVGTITEISDYLRVLYARIGVQHCPDCDVAVQPLSTDQVVKRLRQIKEQTLLLSPLIENRKGEFRGLIDGLRERGYARVRLNGQLHRLDESIQLDKRYKHTLELVVDRLTPSQVPAARLRDSVETALTEGDGTILVVSDDGEPLRLSRKLACPECGRGLPDLSPQSFSFNSPLGMCSACNGLGHRWEMDPELVVPDPSKSIREGAIAPLASVMEKGRGWNYRIFLALRDAYELDLDQPFVDLPEWQQKLVLYGDEKARRIKVKWRGRRSSGTWATHYEGILNTLMRRYRETRSQGMRDYYQKYFSDAQCQECEGSRLTQESRAVRVADTTIVAVNRMSVERALAHVDGIRLNGNDRLIAAEVLKEIRTRLQFLQAVGLNYLTLDRIGPSLSGGEAQRIRLASQLGSELSGVMYVLDEPSIGLHQRDNRRLIETLCRLRDLGNTVIVVEHDRDTIVAADHVVDFGPGAGSLGGKVVFSGTPSKLKRSRSLTGRFLDERENIPLPESRRPGSGQLKISGARENNLKTIDVAFPLSTLTLVTGVSGAGKSSLITGTLYPALCEKINGTKGSIGAHRAIEGTEQIDKVIHIDQSPIGRTPRSNPATYTKCFDLIRDLFSQTPTARTYGYKPGRFSFNVRGGRCEACEGDGVKRVEMHFLPDVFVPCEVCRGKRYNEATLQVTYKGLSIAQVLDLSVRAALDHFANHPKLVRILQTLADVGLDYVKLGQPAPTLSGGEAQRVKLSRELAKRSTGKTFYVLDEPTTGLHFDDIRKLLVVLDRLVEAGNTVVVIEHNLDVIKCADHVIDLGPEGGDQGGKLVAVGTPEEVAKQARRSATGLYLREVLPKTKRANGKRKAKSRTQAKGTRPAQQLS